MIELDLREILCCGCGGLILYRRLNGQGKFEWEASRGPRACWCNCKETMKGPPGCVAIVKESFTGVFM